jgi:dethiobiotin synthetase
MTQRGVFITGTDTGVGKTVLAAGLLQAARARGIDAAPMKPVQTGATVGQSADLRFCLAGAGMRPGPEDRALMCPVCLRLAASPHLAARAEGKTIRVPQLAQAFRLLNRRYRFIIVEGAGGVCVPLNARATMLDLMKKLGLPVVLAARPSLGTINHTLLSLQALRAAGLDVRGVVLVDATARPWGRIERDNLATVSSMGEVPVARLPFVGDLRRDFSTVGKICAKISNDWKILG